MDRYEIVGGQYVMGEDDDFIDDALDGEVAGYDYEIGAAAPRRQRRMVRRQFSQERGLILPFGRQTVALNASAEFTANPQVPFRPATLVIAATDIDGLVVDDIRVGKNSMLASAGAVPASMFGAASTFRGFKFDTAVPGIQIVLQCTDVSGAANTVAIAMTGVAAQ